MVFLWIIFTSEYVNPRIRACFNKRGIKSKEERETERASERERDVSISPFFLNAETTRWTQFYIYS